MSVFKDLLWFFKLERKSYIIGILVLIIVATIIIFPPYAVGIVVDHIIDGTLTETILLNWILLIMLSAILLYILRYVWRIMIYSAAARLSRILRNKLYKHFTEQSPSFYNQQRIGDLMAHATNDIQAVEVTAGDGILTLIDSITLGSIVIILMSTTISWELTLICLLPMPFMALTTSYYGNLIHKRFYKAQAAFSNLNDKVQESISGMRVIKSFGKESSEQNDFSLKSIDTVNKNIAVAKVDALFDPTITFIVGISYFLAIGFGARYVVLDELTIGKLTTFVMYLGKLIWPMLAFGYLFNIVERGRASYDRINILLNTKPEIINKESALEDIPKGNIKFEINSFTYPGKTYPTIKNINFTINKGQTLGIIGKTGSGKTTLLRLLLREFDLDDGQISIGDKSIYDYTLNSLRSAMSYVPQEHFLFSTTVAENIAFAKPSASLEEIQSVAKLADVHTDIINFNNGYGTIIGERGTTLSGGQKQRISIARAFLINSDILILDDALSAVDAKTEETILLELQKNRLNKTTLIATHRISSIQHADLIIVLDNGEIVDSGTHEELIRNDNWYKEIFRRQQLENLVELGGVSNE
ncbi:MAG: ABC transporter transmembrane domain-containing protein [Vulcanibacillus sp.]